MTELEKIERAKMYIDKLANGINPLDDSIIPDDEVVNQLRISRCLFYVSDVLRQVLENGTISPPAKEKKPKKCPFFLPYEKREAFCASERPIPITELCKRISELSEEENMKPLCYQTVRNWLVETGLLQREESFDGKLRFYPSENGVRLGITVGERMSVRGPYSVILYDHDAQCLILDNLDAILESAAT